MKTTVKWIALLALFSTLGLQLSAAPLGTAFTYQGKLTDGGAPAQGIYDLRFAIYDAATNGSAVAGPLTNSTVTVSNGLFTTALDFGNGVFTGEARWLEIGVRTNGGGAFATLNPRQPVTPMPYALHAPNAGSLAASNLVGIIPDARIGTNVARLDTGGRLPDASLSTNVALLNGSANFSGTVTAPAFSGNGSALTNLDATNLASGTVPGARLAGTYSGAVNLTNSGNNFVGTFNGNGGPLTNLNATKLTSGFLGGGRLSGAYSNALTFSNPSNSFTGDGSGLTNLNASALTSGLIPSARLQGNYSSTLMLTSSSNRYWGKFIGDGSMLTNFSYTFTGSNFAGNGYFLTDLNADNIGYGLIADEHLSNNIVRQGGNPNFNNVNAGGNVQANGNVVAGADLLGGRLNVGLFHVLAGNLSSIAGGQQNTITNADYAFIGGGIANSILEGRMDANCSVIGGGSLNLVSQSNYCSTIGGGENNLIGERNLYSTIGGGSGNTIQSNASLSAISGGSVNSIQSGATYSTIGGGFLNTINPDATYATIPGGYQNEAGGSSSFAAGSHAHALNDNSFVWSDGWTTNFASTDNRQFLISAFHGVGINTNNPQAALHVFGTVKANAFVGDGSGLTGVGGGGAASNHTHAASAIVSGTLADVRLSPNVALLNSAEAAFSGTLDASRLKVGAQHTLSGARAAIAGGFSNTNSADDASVCGGSENAIRAYADGATIGGGEQNSILTGALDAVIPGGAGNVAGGQYSFAAGYHARSYHSGAFVWADTQESFFDSTAGSQFLIRAANGVGINTNNPQTALHVRGTTRTGVLEITGGSDLAEPFPTSSGQIPKGAVVVIDEANPGRLKLSDLAYDTKVAGIISGANGINPGISLSQEGLTAGGQNVALSGRVYALADASNGPINPGDLLTTSATPGHAMKVTNHAKAQGAILGKAMTGLKEGKGTVLVLVSLQ